MKAAEGAVLTGRDPRAGGGGKARPLGPAPRPRPDRTPGPGLARGLRRTGGGGGKGGAAPGQAASLRVSHGALPPHRVVAAFPRAGPGVAVALRRETAASRTKRGKAQDTHTPPPSPPGPKRTVRAAENGAARPPTGRERPKRGRGPTPALGGGERRWRRLAGALPPPGKAAECGGCPGPAPAPVPPFPYLAPAPSGPGRRRFRGAAGAGPERGVSPLRGTTALSDGYSRATVRPLTPPLPARQRRPLATTRRLNRGWPHAIGCRPMARCCRPRPAVLPAPVRG